MIAEVIFEATRRIDEGEKREAYLTIPTLTAYLLVESNRPRVVVHHRSGPQADFIPEAYEGLDAIIPLHAIGAELRLVDLYTRVEFGADDPERDDEVAD